MRYLTYIFWILIVILGVFFASLNSHVITINYYLDSIRVYFPLLLLIELALGALLGILVMFPVILKGKANNRKLRARIRQMEQEVKNLRSIPIEDKH